MDSTLQVDLAPTTVETAEKLGLLESEYEKIKSILGRTPNFAELSIFSVMWSEHCCYKNSILWLKKLPKKGPRMLVEAGEENAGLVDIGDGLACSFKIESHNHPSAIEPYQGAATGVGGINRDIFTMGARPVVQLNSLRFGQLDLEKTQWIMKGVVKGIGNYGNSFGIPTVGGEIYFDPCYNTNPLVNAFSAGVVETDKIASAIAKGVGNPVFIVGSATGKDGIHGAAFASKDITEDSAKDLPSVQVGDPFQEKLLLEATLEVIATGKVVGIQDMGAAGIICSTSEMSAKGEAGMDIDLDKVPTRQDNMSAWEILLSESQERMLVVIEKGSEQQILDIFEKWDLNCAQIGTVTDRKDLRFHLHGELVAQVPCWDLVLGGGAPVYEREVKEPAYFKEYQAFDPASVAVPSDLTAVAKFLLAHPNLCSRDWVAEQYDSMVGTANTRTNEPADAGVVSVKGTSKGLAVSVDCNSRYVKADPRKGTAIAVAESARNITCAGGIPSAITNCLNFGNPYVPEVYWQFTNAIMGMKDACEVFKTPVTGGNVSFYNQSPDGGPVHPTPTIGMLGLLDDIGHQQTLAFQAEGDHVVLLGKEVEDIASSEYLYHYHQVAASPAPYFDLDEELALQKAVQDANAQGMFHSLHDVSEGGLFVAVAESALAGGVGAEVLMHPTMRADAYLFGEAQGRIVASCSTAQLDRLLAFMAERGVAARPIGTVAGSSVSFGDLALSLSEIDHLRKATLPSFLN